VKAAPTRRRTGRPNHGYDIVPHAPPLTDSPLIPATRPAWPRWRPWLGRSAGSIDGCSRQGQETEEAPQAMQVVRSLSAVSEREMQAKGQWCSLRRVPGMPGRSLCHGARRGLRQEWILPRQWELCRDVRLLGSDGVPWRLSLQSDGGRAISMLRPRRRLLRLSVMHEHRQMSTGTGLPVLYLSSFPGPGRLLRPTLPGVAGSRSRAEDARTAR
jgi:hypothetical protein